MIEVSAAIIKKEGKILIAQRNRNKSQSFKWEFPGGKVEAKETAEESLKREIKEELNIDIDVKEMFDETVFEYSNGSIKLMAFNAEWISGDLKVLEHEKIEWVTIEELKYYDFAPADIPFIKKLEGIV
ncbi:(deoxy)nucleoside triphosphate pyrophosphohydrolase [Natronincola ferrireducens]|uniref:8-oxo-dGTP diphosphatase n=1 Tax=Natronincola ferrireducens TaxID=393762 RepID=A0A1G9GL28_9FIRM|nr:(deoxy)nucleoside triphosphate pyrophosphohydrolase [Natronincola ferrireducens]SDL01312.1 8-oxo-dGTP diphosphatase [Natronincola ferrireducens]